MKESGYVLRATHAKSKEQMSLQVQSGQIWSVGRQDGTERLDRWNIPFDPALSRDHFRAIVGNGKLTVEASKNRHPIHFEGGPKAQFVVALGQKFLTAHTVFEFGDSSLATEDATVDLDKSLDLLSVTAMISILVNGGFSYGRVFSLLNAHHGGWLQPVLRNLETAVLQEGETLSKALGRYPSVFSDIYVAMVELGESTNLGRQLDRLYRQLAREHQKSRTATETTAALAAACRTVAELLEGGSSETKALTLAAKVCLHEPVRQALLALNVQVQAGTRLAECTYPPLFTPLFTGLIAAHDSVGSMPTAFRDLAEFLGP